MKSLEIFERGTFYWTKIFRLEYQKPCLAHNQDYAKGRGLKPKVKSVSWRRIERTRS